MIGVIAGSVAGPLVASILALAWAFRSRTPWSEIGYGRPKRWMGTVAAGLAFGVASKLLMKAVVMPLLGADPINRTYHYLAGNTAALPGMLLAIIFVAGFGEETLFRGYLFERLGKLFGRGVGAQSGIVLFTSALFGLAHYQDQGLPGAQQAAIVGLMYGTMYAVTGRIWLSMVTHIAFDLTAVAIIYWDLETYVARLVFK